jgi:hypothetical protein
MAVGCGRDAGSQGFSSSDAGDLMRSYVAALRSGDVEEIRRHWSRESLARDGFETMHLWVGGTIHITQWSDFLRDSGTDYEIKGVRSGNGYNVIDFEWVDEARHEMHYYVIRDDDEWVLGNPIDVLTREWDRYETEHLVFRYSDHVDINLHMDEIERMDLECRKMLDALEIELDGRIEFFKVVSPEECGKLVCFPPANGYAVVQKSDRPNDPPWFNVAVSTSFNNPHEIMHVLTAIAGIPYVSAAFCEGYAVAFGGTTYQNPEFAMVQARNLMGEPSFIRLKTLLTMEDPDFLRSSYITYQEAGSFVRFAIDRFGIAKLRQVCDELVMGTELGDAFEKSYGLNVAELEAGWREHLFNLDAFDIGTSVAGGAETVFAMTDPSDDDTGDGDYTYPGEGLFAGGAFDLRAFEVLRDSARVYFRVKMGRVIDPVTYHSGDERFAPGVVIAIKRGETGPHRLQPICHEVEFEQGLGYDIKLSAGFGVSLSDSFGKVFYASGDLSGEMLKRDENTLEFSLPVAMIGEPQSDWRYFVGVGLVSDRTMNFFGGPLPVFKEHTVLISGGDFSHGNPAFIDILLPEETDQEAVLGAYDAARGIRAVVPMFGPGG